MKRNGKYGSVQLGMTWRACHVLQGCRMSRYDVLQSWYENWRKSIGQSNSKKWQRKLLYCSVQCSTVQYCTVLYCTTLYCTALCCTAWWQRHTFTVACDSVVPGNEVLSWAGVFWFKLNSSTMRQSIDRTFSMAPVRYGMTWKAIWHEERLTCTY